MIRAVPILDGNVNRRMGGRSHRYTDQRQAEHSLQEHANSLERQIRHRQRAEEQMRQLNESLEATRRI